MIFAASLRLFIDTGLNKQARDDIAAEITKQLPKIKVINKRDEAEVFIVFEGGVRHLGGVRKERWGQGWVFRIPNENTIRLIASFEMPREQYTVGATPVEALSSLFVREYRKGNESTPQ